uniref:Uncharacterized protein n=1 Tax=Leersia perrieri TaxID=77586 RepID=A0A0D9XD12_9ORYZ
MSTLMQLLRFLVFFLSIFAVAAGAGEEMHDGIVVGPSFIVCRPSCVVAGVTTDDGDALARSSLDLVGHKSSKVAGGVLRWAGHNNHGDAVLLPDPVYGDEKPSARSPTSSMRDGEPRGRGGDNTFNTNCDDRRWRAHPPAVDAVASLRFVDPVVDALHQDIPKHISFNHFPMLHRIATDRTAQPSTRDTVLIALMIMTVRFGLSDQKKKIRRRGSRAAAATTTLILVMLLSVAALPNGAAAARPLHDGGGGHVQAAAPPPAMVTKSFASSGRSSCTNDPNTMETGPCVHH